MIINLNLKKNQFVFINSLKKKHNILKFIPSLKKCQYKYLLKISNNYLNYVYKYNNFTSE